MNTSKSSENIKKMTAAGMLLAVALLLPFVTGQIPEVGNALLPMHFPVILCGFICGWKYGGLIGFIAPLLRYALFGMPPIVPKGIPMAFELATYGIIAGLAYMILSKKMRHIVSIYVSLILAMIVGRIIWGIATVILLGVQGAPFTFPMFMAGAIINAVPGIIAQLIIIPISIVALKKSRLVFNN